MLNLTLQFDPILSIIAGVAVRLWWLRVPPTPVITTNINNQAPSPVVIPAQPAVVVPAPEVNVTVSPATPNEVRVLVPGDVSRVAQDAHRAAILHKQPDGGYQEIGHVDFYTRELPGSRILKELTTPGRAVRWPDGMIQEGTIPSPGNPL